VLVGRGEMPEAVRQACAKLASEETARIADVSALANGSEILSGAIIEPRFEEQNGRERLAAAVTRAPQCIGIGIADKSALIVRGRRLEVIGEGSVTVILAAAAGRPLREIELKPGARHDLTMLRRAAIERSLADFPPQVPPEPRVEYGSLLIVGGGSLPGEITGKFIELAGGSDSPIVILPIAGGETLPEDASGDTRMLARAGAKNVRSLRARTRAEVDSPEFAAALREARGVWFNGGRQWRFVDAYMGTQAEALFRDVLRRGGVIGGSSAGASIQSQYMPRGSPLDNTDMLADGYERGLGFLPGTAIDQHFTQRRRHGDMTLLARRYPQLLGIGIDEATALVVQGGTAQIIGRGKAHFYDYREGPPAGERDFTPVVSGQTYDLVRRKIAE
jgi:cyanophycinase